ncbi:MULTISPECIES: hypothetical protein [unclassified Lelliottia]|uniref:hypothetical protein n=1 Tax=unclassified Lelliottia TaxID=2642424 RepID=UPI001304683B|nr:MULTISPECIES: hypothetical protein [unclassified Lelliottia]
MNAVIGRYQGVHYCTLFFLAWEDMGQHAVGHDIIQHLTFYRHTVFCYQSAAHKPYEVIPSVVCRQNNAVWFWLQRCVYHRSAGVCFD